METTVSKNCVYDLIYYNHYHGTLLCYPSIVLILCSLLWDIRSRQFRLERGFHNSFYSYKNSQIPKRPVGTEAGPVLLCLGA